MTEKPSNTTNHQRLEEMMVHLTPMGSVIPYTLCRDSDNYLWVGSKGGLFKLDVSGEVGSEGGRRRAEGVKVVIEQKHPFPKKVSPYVQVLHHDSRVGFALL